VIRSAIAAFDWNTLKEHFGNIGLSRDQLTDVCGHLRRHTDLICKYPREEFEHRRAHFFDQLRTYVETLFGGEVSSQVTRELELIELVEHGYRSILNVLAKCDIGKQPATIRVAGTISRACHEYQDLFHRHRKVLSETKELNLMSDIRLRRR
jgi:hypothetical protein